MPTRAYFLCLTLLLAICLGLTAPASWARTDLGDPFNLGSWFLEPLDGPGSTEYVRGRPGILVEGDSISTTVSSRLSLRRYLVGWRLSIDARAGRSARQGLQRLKSMRLEPTLVFALGTNNWRSGWRQNRAWIQEAIGLAGPNRCVVLTTITSGDGLGNAILRSEWNDQVWWAARWYGPWRVQVADWALRITRGDILIRDGTHPSDDKAKSERSLLIADAARRCADRISWAKRLHLRSM